MTRYKALLLAFTFGVGAASPLPAQVPADSAAPSDVYLLYHEHQSRQVAELKQAAEALKPLQAEGREEEMRRAWEEVLASLDPESMAPFVSQARRQEWTAIPEADRQTAYVHSLSPVSVPVQVEVRNEFVEDDDRAALDVRGYFDEVMTGEPGWIAGTVTLVREGGGWKVDEVAWGAPGSGEDDAPRGRFEVSGAVEGLAESATVSPPVWAGYGGGWGFSLSHDSDGRRVLSFNHIPETLAPGAYPLADADISVDADGTARAASLSAIFSDEAADDRWDEDVTGTLTVEAVENDRISGRFEFTAENARGAPVTVRGSFRNVELPGSER